MSDKTKQYYYEIAKQGGYLIRRDGLAQPLAHTGLEIFAEKIVACLNEVPPIEPDRMKIAAMAMQGLLSNSSLVDDYAGNFLIYARDAVEATDTLLSELSKPKA